MNMCEYRNNKLSYIRLKHLLFGGAMRETTITDEYQRLRCIQKIIQEANRFTESNYLHLDQRVKDTLHYETSNIVERMLLSWANRATLDCMPDPILNGNEEFEEYVKDLTYQRQ